MAERDEQSARGGYKLGRAEIKVVRAEVQRMRGVGGEDQGQLLRLIQDSCDS